MDALQNNMMRKTPQELAEENESLRQEVNDLKLLLEAATGHSDGVEADLLEKVNAVIRDSENRFRHIIGAVPMPILIGRASDGAVLYANAAAGALFNERPEALINRNATDCFEPDERRMLRDALLEGGRVRGMEVKGRDALNNDLLMELYMEKTVFGQEDCLLVLLQDITEKRMLEKQLRQSQKMEAIGTLAGGIAHDFNNILAGLTGYAELALSLSGENTRIYNYLNKLLAGCDRAKNLIRQILTFSRQTEQEFKPVQAKPIIKEAIRFFRSSLPSTIVVTESIRSDAYINADPTQIHQVLMNLCANAHDAMREGGGTLAIELTEKNLDHEFSAMNPGVHPGPHIHLRVGDTGCGMSPEVQKRIFDPFYTTKAPGCGTGLGLSMVHGIVKNHGGVITAASAPGRGSRFDVYLPVMDRQPAAAPPQENGKLQTGSETILLVDDDPFIAEMMEEQLNSLGYATELVMQSGDALTRFRSDPSGYDIVITDMTMPGMTGDRLAVELMRVRPNVPVILCSGDGVPVDKAAVLKSGVKAFLSKPFSKKDIAAAIREALA